MGKTEKRVQLSDRDRKTIDEHRNICTDAYGKGCFEDDQENTDYKKS